MLQDLDSAATRLAGLLGVVKTQLDIALIQDLSDTAATSEDGSKLVYRPWYVAALHLATSDEVNLLKVETLQFNPKNKIDFLLKTQARIDAFTISQGFSIAPAFSALETLQTYSPTEEVSAIVDVATEDILPGFTVI